MTAIACLRILVAGGAPDNGRSVPVSQVEAAADLYLKHRWKAPRRYGAVAPLAFVLVDNRAERLDPVEMQALAIELEAGLFPGREVGQVCLMTFEGDESAVLQFASLSQAALAGLIAGRGYGGPPGHVQVITAEEIRAVPSAQGEGVAPVPEVEAAPASAPAQASAAAPAPAAPIQAAPAETAAKPAPPPAKSAAKPAPAPERPKPPPPPATGWWGLYHPPSESFVGALIGLRADLLGPRPVEDAALLTRDLTCLNDAQAAFAKAGDAGMLFLPFSFWNLTSPASQEAYKRRLSRFPMAMQGRLGATIYDTPREPSLGLLSQIRAFLQPTFAFIDLNITEPNFPVATLPGDLATSITLSLPDDEPRIRIEAIAKFASLQAACRAKGLRQGVTGLRDAKELEACRAAGLRFVSGPAITDMMASPIGAAPAVGLPLKVA
uniref:EAL domain-containing protein n=1 Tax=Caulobacter sp. (strain K31) TaxID=366602 RepID=B0SWY5_CAUSK